ncbi:MAG TPA: LLM class flavin-dependent oxidoreductase [Chloroflexia bacterium]|nr:LLM class flavin-dependent oxidoreductase [Chloroflexia bacterium]
MTPIQFGLSLPSGARDKDGRATYLTDLRRGLELVSGQFDSAWFVDHLQWGPNDTLDGWTALTYMAAQHPALQFGHAVLCQSFRNPALLAKMAASFQFLTSGRFILGIGAGWKEDEYRAYGYDFPTAGVRVEELDETLQIIRAMWRDEPATVTGKHYRVEGAWCEPRPDPLPPVMVGGSKPRMLRVVARHADWWNVSWTGIDRYRAEVAECERACAALDRDPATLRRTWFGGCFCSHDEAEAQAWLRGRNLGPDSFGFVGTPAQIVDQMRPFVELGVDYFMLGWGGFPDLTTPELLLHEVLPAVQELRGG